MLKIVYNSFHITSFTAQLVEFEILETSVPQCPAEMFYEEVADNDTLHSDAPGLPYARSHCNSESGHYENRPRIIVSILWKYVYMSVPHPKCHHGKTYNSLHRISDFSPCISDRKSLST